MKRLFFVLGVGAILILGSALIFFFGDPSRLPVSIVTGASKTELVAQSAATTALSPASMPAPLTPEPQTGSSYTYNAQGQLQAIQYPDGTVYTYVYDTHGNKIRETTRTGRTWTYGYNASGQPLFIIDPEGRRIQPAPDPADK